MMKKLIAALSAVALVGLACPMAAPAEEEHEATLNASEVPAAVQKAAQSAANGGRIVRWEKEGSNYEAVIEKGGKQTGIEITAAGKVKSRHDEAKEHKEKGDQD